MGDFFNEDGTATLELFDDLQEELIVYRPVGENGKFKFGTSLSTFDKQL